MILPTVNRPDSVRFQKDFQNCMSRFWVMRSNSAPRSSGSITYFPDVRRDKAAVPKGGQILILKMVKGKNAHSEEGNVTFDNILNKIKKIHLSQTVVYHRFLHMKPYL